MNAFPGILRRGSAALVVLALTLCASAWSAPAALPWNLEALSKAPKWSPAPEFQEKGVQAIFFDGLPYHGKPTRVFAWYGVPQERHGQRCPAMVLVHGGGGTAFAEWVRLWVSRGYAAIAMDTCGSVPKGTYGHWERHAQGGPPGWGGFEAVDEPLEDQWPYQAVADVMLAHSWIRALPEVDPERTGITGISWGGYLTCLTAGADARFKFAAPVYGCGFLGEDSAWLGTFQQMGDEKARRWLAHWDPSVLLPRAKMPMLWVTGTNDFAYPMDSLQKSYRLPGGPRTLCIRLRMPHAHGGAGENPDEIRAFAENQFRNGEPLPRISARGQKGREAWAVYEPGTPAVSAELLYTCDTGKWQDRLWQGVPADLDPALRRASALVPENARVYYFNLIDAQNRAVSSEHVELQP